MSDPPKTTPTFSFGAPATSGGSGLFGQPVSSSNKPTSNIFGTGAAPNNTQTSNIFGGANTPATTSSSSPFTGFATSSGASQPSLFGSTANPGPPSSLFGSIPSTGGNTFGGTSNSSNNNNAFGGFATPNKPSDGSGQTQTSNLFGGGSNAGGSSLFGNAASAAVTFSQPGSTTPAASKPDGGWSFGSISTTPAGPPPTGGTDTAAAGAGFSFKPQEKTSNLFGATTAAQSSAPTTTSTSVASNPFGGTPKPTLGFSFGTSKPAESPAAGATAPSSSTIFGGPQSQLFGGGNNDLKPTVSLFNNVNKAPDNTGQQSQGEAAKPGGLFPSLSAQKPLSASTTQSSGTSLFSTAPSSSGGIKSPFSFPPLSTSQEKAPNNASTSSGGQSSSASATAPAASSGSGSLTAPGSNLFTMSGGLGSNSNTSTPTSAPSTTAPSKPAFPSFPNLSSSTATTNSPFSAVNPSKDTGSANSQKPPTTSAPASAPASSAPPLTNLFGGPAKQPAGTTTSQTTPQASSTGTADDASKANPNLGTSTSGPRPPAQSRLKNKSMDEIITRWASDLSKYQKEFQKQAQKVANWDRMLVENSDKIQKLYGNTLEAERATVEVERQLTAVENDQAELEYWLDHYEQQVDDMISAQVGPGDALQGPDQERERTYKLAEKLSDRLDEMGKDLTSMIEEINDASSNLSKNSKSDDPLSQIVRVLNGHLSQLQQIDQGAAALQAKVAAAQKAGKSIRPANGANGLGGDAVDDFYRSYMGRR
ncbi:MAG: hypothetical protein Q9187_001960 [Circinaria calcarea]